MHRIFLFLFVMIFAGSVFSQAPVKQLKERELDGETVRSILQKYNSDIISGEKNKKPLSSLKYSVFCNQVQNWLKYRWFIADTGLSIKWLKDIHELLEYMQKTKSYMEVAVFNGETKTPQYGKALEYFNTAQIRLTKLINNPVRVSAKVRRKAKQQKAAWQKAMKKNKK